MRKSLVSLVALGLFIGAPALVDTAAADSTTDTKASQSETTANQSGTTASQSGTTASESDTTANQSGSSGTSSGQAGATTEELAAERGSEILDSDRINQMFGEAQFEQSTDIEGRIARAMTSEGHEVLVFIGPSDMGTGDRVDLEDNDLRDRLQQGGFASLHVFAEPHIVRADLDEEHYIFALAADELSSMHSPLSSQTGGQTETEMDTQAGTATGETETETETGTAMGESGTGTDTEVGTESETAMGETGTELDTESESAMGETGTELDTESETAMGETGTGTDTEVGTESETAMGETGTDTAVGTESETAMGETGTDTETAMDETGTGTDTEVGTDSETAMGETGTEMDTESETAMGETGTGTDTELGTESETAMGETGTGTDTQVGTETETAMGTDTEAGVTGEDDGQISRGISEPMSEDLVRGAEEAGLQDAGEFKGRLARATTEDGSSVYLLIAPKDMQADAEMSIQEDDVRKKLEDAGFQDIRFMDDAQIVRGTLEGDNVFVFAGRDLMGTGMQQ